MTALREQYEAIAAALQTIAQAAEQPDLVRQQCAAGQALVQDGKQLLFWTEDLEPEKGSEQMLLRCLLFQYKN